MHTVNTETKRRALGPDRKYFCNEYCPVKPCCAADRAGLPPGLRDVKQCNHECMIRETNYERYEQQVQRHMILFHSAEGNFADKDLFRNLVHHDRLHLCEFKPLNAMESLHAMRDVPIKDYRPKVPPPVPPKNWIHPRRAQPPTRPKPSTRGPIHQLHLLAQSLKEENNGEEEPPAFDTCCNFLKNLIRVEKDLNTTWNRILFWSSSSKIDAETQKACFKRAKGSRALSNKFQELQKVFRECAADLVNRHVFLHEKAKPHARHLPTQALDTLRQMLIDARDMNECRARELNELNLKKMSLMSIRRDNCRECAELCAQYIEHPGKLSCQTSWAEHVRKEHGVDVMDDAWNYCLQYAAQAQNKKPPKKRRKSNDQEAAQPEGVIAISLSSESDTAGDGAEEKKIERALLRQLAQLCCESPCDSKADDAYLENDHVPSPQMLRETDAMLQEAYKASNVVIGCSDMLKQKGTTQVEAWISRCKKALHQYEQSHEEHTTRNGRRRP